MPGSDSFPASSASASHRKSALHDRPTTLAYSTSRGARRVVARISFSLITALAFRSA